MSVKIARFFNYEAKSTVLHRLDPRTKGFMAIVFLIVTFLLSNLTQMCVLLGILLLLLLLGNTLHIFLASLKELRFLLLLIIIVNSLMISVNFAFITITRIVILLGIFGTVFQTTPPEDVASSLLKLHIPYNIAFSIALAFRFVPTIAAETQQTIDAQRSRGHQLVQGGPIAQLRNFIPLLIPMLMNSIRRAFFVAESLETRGFGTNPHPTIYHPLFFQRRDYLTIGCMLLLLSGGVIIHFVPLFAQWGGNLPF